MPYLLRITEKADGRPFATGTDKNKTKYADGNYKSCSSVSLDAYESQVDLPIHLEFQFYAPPLPDDPRTTSWALIVKFVTGNYPHDTCRYPGLTIFINSNQSPYAFNACPRDDTLGSCVFRCSGFEVQKDITDGQRNIYDSQPGAVFFVRLERAMYGEWSRPTSICEIDAAWLTEDTYS